MQFLILCCMEESRWEALPDSERQGLMENYGRLVGQLKERGQYVAGARLEHPARALSVRQKNGKAVVTDGPFAETKEQLGGYHVVEFNSRDEVRALVQRWPTLAAGGVVEVRALEPGFGD